MKNKLLLGALLIGTASLFTSCKDDNDSNPTLIQPTEFALNTPAYINETIDLQNTAELKLTWSQPKYTVDNAPVNITYEIQVSNSGSFTVSTAEALADESGNTVADYAILDRTTQQCSYLLTAAELDNAMVSIAKWKEAETPAEQDVYLRVNAYFLEGTKKLNPILSNVLTLKTNPYYIELSDAKPIMWYLVGNNILDGAWGDKPGESSLPMFIQNGFTYDKKTGAGEITYLNYFTTDGWKIQPEDFNWDLGFMSGGSANTAVFRGGAADAGNIWVDPEGYNLVTVNTGTNECTIVKQDITPVDYDQICMSGSFNNWSDTDMTPANKEGENHVWVYIMTVEEGVVEQVKFKIAGSWDTNLGYGTEDGEVNTCGKGTNGGKNIGVPEGTWIILFNDITGEFSITAKE